MESNIWLKAGFYVRYWNPSTEKFEFHWLKQEENLPAYIFKFDSVAAGENTGYEQVKDLKPAVRHLYQLLMGFQTACLFYLQVPVGTNLGGTDERRSESSTWPAVGFYTQRMSPFYQPDPVTNFYLAYWDQQYFPAVKAYNPTDKALVPRIRFVGKMFETELITEKDGGDLLERLNKRIIPWTPISIGRLPGVGRSR